MCTTRSRQEGQRGQDQTRGTNGMRKQNPGTYKDTRPRGERQTERGQRELSPVQWDQAWPVKSQRPQALVLWLQAGPFWSEARSNFRTTGQATILGS